MYNEVKRKIIHEDEDNIVRIEEVEMNDQKIIFVHVEVKNMTVKGIRFLRNNFDEFKKNVKEAGYDHLHTYSKTPKFYNMFKGFEDIGPMRWNKETYRVLRWELNS